MAGSPMIRERYSLTDHHEAIVWVSHVVYTSISSPCVAIGVKCHVTIPRACTEVPLEFAVNDPVVEEHLCICVHRTQ